MIRTEHLTCVADRGQGARRPVDDVTVGVGAGEIVAVAGFPEDGPGTLLRALAGLARPMEGRIVTDGVSGPGPKAPPGFGYVRSGLTGPDDLTVAEWLRYVADHRGGRIRTRSVRVQGALSLVALVAAAGRRIGLLDRDEAERLAIATLAVSGADVLLLDACFAGIHAATRRVLAAALADLAMQGRAVVIAPCDIRAVEDVATRVVVMRNGRVIADLRMGVLQRQRVAELRLNGGALAAVPRLVAHFPDAVRTGTGLDVPLTADRTLEFVLAVCRSERVPVLGTRVRYAAVEDLLRTAPPAPDPARVMALG